LRRALGLFFSASVAGLVALGFNFLIRLGGIAAYPPESALSWFLGVIPASIEEPMVQQFGDLAGQLGLIFATLVAAAVYGIIAVLFDRFAARKVAMLGLSRFEGLLTLGIIPWLLFGLVVFPIGGDSFFGVSAPFAAGSMVWLFPFSLLLVQGVFAWAFFLGYHPPVAGIPVVKPGLRPPSVARREFIEKGIIGIAALAAAIVGLTGLGSIFSSQVTPSGGSQPIDLQDAPAIFRDPRLTTLVDSEVTPNNDFYRVAIDIIDPTVDASSWSLMVDGLVNNAKQYSLQDIQGLPPASQYSTFECVSNELNGNLISNALWEGVKISDLLADAGGVQAGSSYVVFYSVDGYSVGIPLAKAMMDDSLLVYNMNGQALPTSHGYPLRAVIPGLYGMMSAKWIKRVSVISGVYQGYWQTRGWSNDATIFTETFIAVPGSAPVSLSQNGGSAIVAGYAFAGERGVSKVEVSLDNGSTWQEAQLKKPLSNRTWALWAYEWSPQGPGRYQVIARATDGGGQVQTSASAPTFPNGATGYVMQTVQVVA
jgi:DMSO/TMAO reductase YedYZ molybdopterin-dependent catalytic subunit